MALQVISGAGTLQGYGSNNNPGVPIGFPQAPPPQAGPTTYDTTGTSSGSSGGTSAATYTPPADLSSYDQSIGNVQSGIDRLGTQQAVGQQNILDSYNSAYNTLLGQKAQANQQYTTNKNTEGQAYVGQKNNINSGTGQAINAAQRLLGAHGAGGSSAALYNAPEAATRQGALQRNEAGQTFSQNNQKLDQGWGDFQNNWNNSSNDLSHQRDVQGQQFSASIDQNRASLLQQLAGLQTQRAAASGMTTAQAVAAGQPYIDQANQSLSTADQLGQQWAHPVLQATPVQYTAPTLGSYLAAQHGPTTINGGTSNIDAFAPSLAALLGKKQDINQIGA